MISVVAPLCSLELAAETFGVEVIAVGSSEDEIDLGRDSPGVLAHRRGHSALPV